MSVPSLNKCVTLPAWPIAEDIYIMRGSTWPMIFEHELPADCVIKSARFTIRRFDQGQIFLDLHSDETPAQWEFEPDPQAPDFSIDIIELVLGCEDTDCLPEGRWCYSISVECEDGRCFTIKYGRVLIIGHQTSDYAPEGVYVKCELKKPCKPITTEPEPQPVP